MAASASAQPRRLAFGQEDSGLAAISRQGNRLAYQNSWAKTHIWRVDLGDRGHTPGVPVQFIASSRRDWDPAYSPDGTKIAFVSNRQVPPKSGSVMDRMRRN